MCDLSIEFCEDQFNGFLNDPANKPINKQTK